MDKTTLISMTNVQKNEFRYIEIMFCIRLPEDTKILEADSHNLILKIEILPTKRRIDSRHYICK